LPCSADPYKYIRSGSYARILSQMALATGISTPEQKKLERRARKQEEMKKLGLRD
jgi:hypothetical protein